MNRPASRSVQLIAATHQAALQSLATAPSGQLKKSEVQAAIERLVPLDAWARENYESTGTERWRSILAFSSVGMVKAGYVTKARGSWTITQEGRAVIARPFDPQEYLAEVHRRYRAWSAQQIHSASPDVDIGGDEPETSVVEPPDERIAQTIKSAHQLLAAELVDTVKSCAPEFLEHLVVQLLLKMGYGGSRQEAGRAVGRSGDGGIDGIISEDRLGLDAIYIQAKRWTER